MCQPRSLQIKNTERDRETEKIVMRTFLAHTTVLNEAKKRKKEKKREPALSVGACLTQVGL